MCQLGSVSNTKHSEHSRFISSEEKRYTKIIHSFILSPSVSHQTRMLLNLQPSPETCSLIESSLSSSPCQCICCIPNPVGVLTMYHQHHHHDHHHYHHVTVPAAFQILWVCCTSRLTVPSLPSNTGWHHGNHFWNTNTGMLQNSYNSPRLLAVASDTSPLCVLFVKQLIDRLIN